MSLDDTKQKIETNVPGAGREAQGLWRARRSSACVQLRLQTVHLRVKQSKDSVEQRYGTYTGRDCMVFFCFDHFTEAPFNPMSAPPPLRPIVMSKLAQLNSGSAIRARVPRAPRHDLLPDILDRSVISVS